MTTIVIDHQTHRITVDGRDITAPHVQIVVKTIADGLLARVDIGLYADNVVIITKDGRATSPTAAAEARAIVRRGLADILTWLGEAHDTGDQEQGQ